MSDCPESAPIAVEEGADLQGIFCALAEQAPNDWARWQFILAESLDHVKEQIVENYHNIPDEQARFRGIQGTVSAIRMALASLPELEPHLGYLDLLSSELMCLAHGKRSEIIAPISHGKRGRPRASPAFSARVGRVGATVEIMQPWCHSISEAAQFVLGLLSIEARKGQPTLGWQGERLSLSSIEDWHSKCISNQGDRHTGALFNATCAFAEDYFCSNESRANAEEAVRWFLSGAERPPNLAPQKRFLAK